ncbi:MAG TPA: response regulator [Candidatus Marinimicrobia bacterium]|nr:response regulator [Candidatus Neomarinimicrobiota bacterium]HQE94811.1 response regulator [Candidatus Neomarinimicrobiota bacterium]HQH55836.1 response regulator [Candidatus Neomarinimicrobiota bacterium]
MQSHILVVDDDQTIRMLCKEILEEAGYKVTLAADGEEALEKMDYDDFDLYLVDMVMPKMDGLELMKKIKQKQPLAVVMILTGFSSIEGAIKAVHAGAFQYLSKPINIDELLNAVKEGIKYSQDLYGPLLKIFEPGTELVEKGEMAILSGFSEEDKQDFMILSSIYNFEPGENIRIADKMASSIILIESGEVSVWLSNTSVDYLKKWDTWNEESFVINSPTSSVLRAETAVTARFFERKKLLEFFAFKGEKLLKKFMINLINCLYIKWRKSIQRIIMLKLVTTESE